MLILHRSTPLWVPSDIVDFHLSEYIHSAMYKGGPDYTLITWQSWSVAQLSSIQWISTKNSFDKIGKFIWIVWTTLICIDAYDQCSCAEWEQAWTETWKNLGDFGMLMLQLRSSSTYSPSECRGVPIGPTTIKTYLFVLQMIMGRCWLKVPNILSWWIMHIKFLIMSILQKRLSWFQFLLISHHMLGLK